MSYLEAIERAEKAHHMGEKCYLENLHRGSWSSVPDDIRGELAEEPSELSFLMLASHIEAVRVSNKVSEPLKSFRRKMGGFIHFPIPYQITWLPLGVLEALWVLDKIPSPCKPIGAALLGESADVYDAWVRRDVPFYLERVGQRFPLGRRTRVLGNAGKRVPESTFQVSGFETIDPAMTRDSLGVIFEKAAPGYIKKYINEKERDGTESGNVPRDCASLDVDRSGYVKKRLKTAEQVVQILSERLKDMR